MSADSSFCHESGKNALFSVFPIILQYLTPTTQKSLRGPFFMSLISNIYPASGPQYHSLCQERFVSFFYKNRLFGDNRPRLCFGGASFSAMVVLLVS